MPPSVGFAKKQVAARKSRAGASARGSAEASVARRAIPLNLAPLLSPYKRRGRLSLRIERLPPLARLSSGRNNGNGSWSLASDELEDLEYLLPEGMHEAHTLAIRIIDLNGGEGKTLAVLDYLVSIGASGSGADEGDTPADSDDEPGSSKQKNETPPAQGRAARKADVEESKFASLTADLLERGGEARPFGRAPRREEVSEAELEEGTSAGVAAGVLARKGEARPSVIGQAPAESSALADAVAANRRAEEELRRARDECSTMQTALAGRDAELAQMRSASEEARQSSQQEWEAALAKATAAWKADETQRFAAAEAQWRQQSAKASAEARAEADAARVQAEAELRRVRDESTALQATLTGRDAALAQAGLDAEQKRERRLQELETALVKATAVWKADEAQRFAAAETQWREQSTKALAQARAEADAARVQAEGELRRARDEGAALKATLSDRDAALSRAGMGAEQEREQRRQELDTALAKATAAWKADEAQRFAAAETQWREQSTKALTEARALVEAACVQADGELRRVGEECAALKAALADRDAALARAGTGAEQERQHQRQELETALAKTTAAWKADEAQRFAAAETQWREQSTKALAEARAEAEAARVQAEGELRRVRDEGAALKTTLSDRDAALSRAGLDAEQERERRRQESEAALAKATAAWKADEAQRLAAAEAQWREQSTRALAEARAEAEARHQSTQIELRRERDELATLQATLAGREVASAQMRSAAEEAQQNWHQQLEGALSKAKDNWKAQEAQRLAAAEAQWREQSTKTLAEARAQAEAARHQDTEVELRRQGDELAALQANLANREATLAQERLAAEQARESWQQQSEAAVSKALAAWKADETARFAAAEAQWRKQYAGPLAEATARFTAAETALAQMRIRASRESSGASHFGGGQLSDEVAMLRTKLSDREAELTQIRLTPKEDSILGAQDPKIVIRSKRIRDVLEPVEQQRRMPRLRGPMRDVVVAATIGGLAILFYPSIAPLLPYSWQSKIAAVTSGIEQVPGGSRAPAEALAPVAPPTPAQHMLVTVRNVNLRASPSTDAQVISTLPRGQKVAMIEQQGDWTHIQVEGDGTPAQGWVSNSFLKDEADQIPPSEEAK